ncbi:oxidoreductase [Gordonia sp. X0973]|uniref:FAD-binding oxidoreductase n=1 Tax=Gordonia sp. X0973 TaxID=2742602 RepID=UPI000F529488|nr:FAD-binding oxidoreductase [Gordonia sp. X0973]QKT08594.1 oxidoreductase [Gordonia sp. X0973]
MADDETRIVLTHLRTSLNADPARFANNFFARLFSLDPSIRDLFPPSLAHLRNAFPRVVDHVLDGALAPTGHGALVELLAQLGRDHRKYGVLPQHYELAGRALEAEFAAVLGSSRTPAAAAAIGQIVATITGVMSGAAAKETGPPATPARVVQKFQISREHAVVRLVAERPLNYLPGQYVEVCIPQWSRSWRMLSPAIPASPTGEVEFHLRAVPGGTVSRSIVLETAVGDVWSIAQNHGMLRVDPNTPTTMIAGGTGLAPLRAILTGLAANVDNPPIHLYYGARHPGELYELATLQPMCAMSPWLSVTAVTEERDDPWWLGSIASPTDLGFPHMLGTLADAVVHDADRTPGYWDSRDVLIAGSPAMIETTERKLLINGASYRRIHHDPVG